MFSFPSSKTKKLLSTKISAVSVRRNSESGAKKAAAKNQEPGHILSTEFYQYTTQTKTSDPPLHDATYNWEKKKTWSGVPEDLILLRRLYAKPSQKLLIY